MNFNRVEYWSDPTKAGKEIRDYNRGRFWKFSQPDFYINQTWGQRLVESCFPYMKKDWSILELGCNTGKTLAYLKDNGFTRLMGVDINRKAIDLGRKNFPQLADVEIICAPLEDVIKDLNTFDMVYASGVYMHLPYTLDWVFEEIAKRARYLIMTAEDEVLTTFERFARNYRTIFEGYGFEMLEWEYGTKYPPLPETTIKRVFRRSDG